MDWANDTIKFLNGGTLPSIDAKVSFGKYVALRYRIGNMIIILSEHLQGKKEKTHIEAICALLKM